MNKCCNNDVIKEKWIVDYKDTAVSKIPIVSTKLAGSDIFSDIKVRWGLGRMKSKIKPGLYCVGNPNEKSDVFVTANYSLTFNSLRKELNGLNAWILVLDTKGINVWCAAGKGTFGTQELMIRMNTVKLKEIVSHKNLILPQLGAVGISAHIIKKATGFKVIYGPVYAKDIKEFLLNDYKKSDEMKNVYFGLKERLLVIPVEVTHMLKPALIILAAVFVFSVLELRSFNFRFLLDFIPFIGAMITGAVLTPILIPLIPFRSFAIKGFVLGILWAVGVTFIFSFDIKTMITNLLLLPPISSFLALNYTGSSTYTSLSGVKIEVRISAPIFIILLAVGIIFKILFIFNVL